MTPFPEAPRNAAIRGRTLVACALAVLVAACGGGADEAVAPAAIDAVATDAADDVGDRRFALWSPGGEADLLAEQARLDPAGDGSAVQLIVRLNPAAVFVDERRAMLGAGGATDADALRARQLAAKVSAVAVTSQGVMTRSVLRLAPTAVVRQQFSHAVEGFVLSVPAAQATAIADELARNPAVDSVEPDRTFSVGQAAPGVRLLDARAWGVDRIDQRTPGLDGAFRQTLTGNGVNVYVVDTGVSPHDEFGTRLVAGFSAINDGRGTTDCNGHGTHVAGTAAGATLGVAPAARVVPVRVMTCTGSSSGSSVLTGLDWVAAQGKRPAVVNLSLGGPVSTALDAAAQRLMTLGFSVVAAAGNDNVDACLRSPGRAAGAITVAASDRADAKAAFSNWGACVALWAPGTAITAAGFASTSATMTMNGTSMAAPHVAGAVALLLQRNPETAPDQIRSQLLAQATADIVTATPGTMTRQLLFAGGDSTATTTPTPTPTPAPTTPSPSVPTPPPPAVATAVVVKSLAMTTLAPSVGTWKTDVLVTVVDNLGKAVANAKVTGRFSNSSKDVSCTTAATGTCSFGSTNAQWLKVPVLGVAITQVKTDTLPYTGGGARSAQVSRPEAPQASVTALAGTMFRAKPTAVNWVPQFMVTVKDEKLATVKSAKVQVVMTVHRGAGVFGERALSCTTSASGECKLAWNGAKLDATHTGAVVRIIDVQRNFLVYKPGALTSASVGTVQ